MSKLYIKHVLIDVSNSSFSIWIVIILIIDGEEHNHYSFLKGDG